MPNTLSKPEKPFTQKEYKYTLAGRNWLFLVVMVFVGIAAINSHILIDGYLTAKPTLRGPINPPPLWVVPFMLVGIVLALWIAWTIFYYARYNRLVISQSGIQYFSFGYKINTSWENIESIEKGSGFHATSRGFSLHESRIVTNNLFNFRLLPRNIDGTFIPFDRFVMRSKRLQFEAHIHEFAPSLI